jgi:Tol biopolymer transport system component
MAATQVAIPPVSSTEASRAADAAGRLDWAMTILSMWLIGGFYVDLWAHRHGRVDDTFLTPWHALLYAGAATFGLTLGVIFARNVRRGVPLRRALPRPYLVSLLGALAFVVTGGFDLLWHSLVGFEVDVEALLSPAHLALAASGMLMLGGPVRSIWSRAAAGGSWRGQGPAVIGLALMLSVFAAFTQYAHPIVDPWAETIPGGDANEPVAQLYAMAPDGTGQRRIAITDEDLRNPRLSPDGTRLAFTLAVERSGQIFISGPDGSNRRQVTTEGNNGRPCWSPDGSRLAFQSDRAGSFDVYTIAADGTDGRRITADTASDWGAAWSPDGTRIAFNSDRAGSFDIYSVKADGTDLVRLTQSSGGDFDPAWSPDGKRIAFTSEQDAGNFEVVSMAADGSDLRRLTDAQGSSYMPAWSPDGSSIAFATSRGGDLEVYVMNADGSDPRNLTRNPGLEDGWLGPSWSPDGRAILYPSQAETPFWRVDFVRQGFGAAGILVQAVLLAGFVLVALRHGPVPFGALTLLLFVPTALMTVVSDQYRFLPGALLAGVFADLLVWRLRFGSSRRSDAVIAFAIPGAFYAAYFATLQLTSGIGWTIHLWLGAILLAGVIGLVLDEAMRAPGPRSSSAPATAL